MSVPSVFLGVILVLHLQQQCFTQMPVRRFESRELYEFRVPRSVKLLDYMNASVDPCVDFYEFACGNWHTNIINIATEETPIRSPLEDLKNFVSNEVRELLEAPIVRYDGDAGRRVKDFYASCLDAGEASRTVTSVFSDFVKKNGGMPLLTRNWDERNYNWLNHLSNLKMVYGFDFIIGVEIKPDNQNHRFGQFYIGEPSTLLSKSVCKESNFADSEFEDLTKTVIENMAYWFHRGENESKELAKQMIEFETKLCRGMSEKSDGIELTMMMPRRSLAELNKIYPSIDFDYFVTTILKQQIQQTVYVKNDDYLKNLEEVMHNTPKTVVANYIMYRSLATIGFPEETDEEKRISLCIEKAMKHFPKVIGEMYHKKHFRTEIIEDVNDIWTELKQAFKIDVNSQLWIEETTRRQAIYKIAGMQLKFPHYSKDSIENDYLTLRIEKAFFWENIKNILEMEQRKEIKKLRSDSGTKIWGPEVEASDVKAEYVPMQNIIRISLGLLQSPVYHITAPTSYKYGVLGFLIAHELIHGFDEIGWNYDENSVMRQWFDQKSMHQYWEQVDCFREQYIDYIGKDASLPLTELDDQIREIVADSGALNISFNAYLNWLEKTDNLQVLLDETLSDINYTNTQLFFIAFAQNFCTSTYSQNVYEGFFPWDVPNRLEKFRVNAPLWNMQEFSTEFNCAEGIDMNNADKCVIY